MPTTGWTAPRGVANENARGLFQIPFVVGVGVGRTPGGQGAVVVLTEAEGANIPGTLDGVPVVVQVTGMIVALGHCPDHTRGKPPPGCGDGDGNTAPVADDQSVSTDTDTNVDIILTGSDADGCDATSFSFSAASPTGGALSSTIGPMTCTGNGSGSLAATVTYDPLADATDDSFTFTISDGGDTSNTATVSIVVGGIVDGGDNNCFEGGDTTARCDRPVPIGVSTGHPSITAGTIGARVTNGTEFWALSNNHVYAATNSATNGDNVLQPGTVDGGIDPADAIGTLADFEPPRFRRGRLHRGCLGPELQHHGRGDRAYGHQHRRQLDAERWLRDAEDGHPGGNRRPESGEIRPHYRGDQRQSFRHRCRIECLLQSHGWRVHQTGEVCEPGRRFRIFQCQGPTPGLSS